MFVNNEMEVRMSFTEQYKEIVKEFYAVDSHENAILSFEDVAKKIGYSFLNLNFPIFNTRI